MAAGVSPHTLPVCPFHLEVRFYPLSLLFITNKSVCCPEFYELVEPAVKAKGGVLETQIYS